jgi:hypothetical protein
VLEHEVALILPTDVVEYAPQQARFGIHFLNLEILLISFLQSDVDADLESDFADVFLVRSEYQSSIPCQFYYIRFPALVLLF